MKITDKKMSIINGGKYDTDVIALSYASERVFLNYYVSWGDTTK